MINRRELNLSDPDSEAMKTKVVNTRAERKCRVGSGNSGESRRDGTICSPTRKCRCQAKGRLPRL